MNLLFVADWVGRAYLADSARRAGLERVIANARLSEHPRGLSMSGASSTGAP